MDTILLILLCIFLKAHFSASIRCCDTVWDYYEINGNCWENPDGESNQKQILERWGATVKENFLTTENGYIILMTTATFNKTQSTPVILAHGQHHNSDSFLTNYNKSLVYHLLQEGYEVNLINWRASKYSRNHVNLSFTEDAYWNFDFHEMGIYDFRKCLHSIFNRTNQKSIYIGFSMGSTISYVYSSIFHEEAQNLLQGIVSLGPLATMTNIRSILRQGLMIWPEIRPIFKIIFGNYLPRIQALVEFWAPDPIRWYLWDLIGRVLVVGPDFEQIDPVYKPVQALLFDDIIPIGILDHFRAIVRAKEFIQKDFGSKKNMEVYGQETPPVYDLSKISVPVAMFVGNQDYLGDPLDAIYIYKNMTNAKCGYSYIKRDEWNHTDFIWAKDMVTLMVNAVLEKIKQLQKSICNDI